MSIHADRILAVRTSKILYLDGDKVVKVFDKDYSKAGILSEALNQARVEETGLHIPKIHAVLMLEGKWTIVSEYIEGDRLQQLMVDHPERLDEYLELFVRLHREIHEKNSPMLVNMFDKMTRRINGSSLSEEKKQSIFERLARCERRNALCHGDFIPSNVMIAKDGTPYALDWSHATQGNPAADTARTYLLFSQQGREDAAEKYLALYCAVSGIKKEEILAWCPLVAAANLVKRRFTEREYMMEWLERNDV